MVGVQSYKLTASSVIVVYPIQADHDAQKYKSNATISLTETQTCTSEQAMVCQINALQCKQQHNKHLFQYSGLNWQGKVFQRAIYDIRRESSLLSNHMNELWKLKHRRS